MAKLTIVIEDRFPRSSQGGMVRITAASSRSENILTADIKTLTPAERTGRAICEALGATPDDIVVADNDTTTEAEA